ncbi:MAG: cyanophycinase [Candidatus Aminicenantes bacterium]|nr:cyanophycinase [Candidatus Aminicenantes bacterium]
MKSRISFFWIFILVLSLFCSQGLAQGPEIGPANGSLVIVGGAMKDPAIIERFLELAGGKDAPIVVIPTAGGAEEYGPYWSGLIQFKEVGATNLTVLHTTDRTVADSEEFVKPIQMARGVFFGGGRQWHLADAYLHTRTHDELFKLLERGGVIGGSSAGATIQGSYLVRGDTKSNTVMMGDHLEGMGFLCNVGIDQHLLKRNRHFDMIEVIKKNPELLGIGLDENTAIVVRRDQFEVIGQSYVVIYDNTSVIPPDGQFFFLAPGDRYNMKTREATRPSQTDRPIERVIKEERKKDK